MAAKAGRFGASSRRHRQGARSRPLQHDGRLPYTKLAAEVGLSEAAVRQRVQRLIESGVCQIVAVTDPLMLGFRRMAMIGVRVEGDLRSAADTIASIPEVDYVVIVGGSFDLLLEVVCEDDDHLLSLLTTRSARSRASAPPRRSRISASTSRPTPGGHGEQRRLSDTARPSSSELAHRHLWMHFSRLGYLRRRPRRSGHRPRRGLLRLATPTASATSTGCRACSRCRSATAATSSPRPRPARPRRSSTSRSGRTRTRRRSSSRPGSPSSRPATSTGCSSRPAGRRPSSRRGSSRASTSSAIGQGTRHKVIARQHGVPRHDARRARDHRRPRARARRSSR